MKYLKNMKQNLWCKLLNLHKYEVLREESILNRHGDIIGTIIISRCSNCGKIKHHKIYTEEGYDR